MDDFLGLGYEEIGFELKKRKETRKVFSEFAELITQTSNCIINSNKNTSKYFLGTKASSLSLQIIFMNFR